MHLNNNLSVNIGIIMIIWYLDLPKQSVPICIKVVSSNPNHGDVHLIQFYVLYHIKLYQVHLAAVGNDTNNLSGINTNYIGR
jgi:hypothetical protein